MKTYLPIAFICLANALVIQLPAAAQTPLAEAPKITSPSAAAAVIDTPFSYQIQADNNPYGFAVAALPTGLAVDTRTGVITGTLTRAGVFEMTVLATNPYGQGSRVVTVTCKSPPHDVVKARELLVIDPAILRTAPQAQPGGSWHFRSVLSRLAPGGSGSVEAFAEAWFTTWEKDEPEKRAATAEALREAWNDANNKDRIRLIAIVNRLDLGRFNGNNIQAPSALGEGRLIYEVVGDQGQALPFTIIMEFGLAGTSSPQLNTLDWALRWHALGRPALQAPEAMNAYLTELDSIVQDYSAGNPSRGHLNQIRTNEILGSPWQLREFHLSPDGSRLNLVPLALTPDNEQDKSPDLVQYLKVNVADFEAGRLPVAPSSKVPDALKSNVESPSFRWLEPLPAGVSAKARFMFSFNTCSGCHAGETGTVFQHIGANAPQGSEFLVGVSNLEFSPITGLPNAQHNELKERAIILRALAQDMAAAGPGGFEAATFALTPQEQGNITALLLARAGRVH